MSDIVYTASCEYCGEQVDPLRRDTWHRVVGWERKGRNGGSDIALREPRDGYAHPLCVRRLQDGISAQQGRLV